MNIKEKAKAFAIQAHKGQIRKNEPDKPMIIHPISVGNLLEEFGCSDEVIAAGYLHDVVEDTEYTLENIEKHFGIEVADLVNCASEPDKSLSWEERKTHTIEETKALPLKNKFVICSDKINNLEDLMIKFQKTGIRDFSLFKRGETQQTWYYTSIYESLIENEDQNLPIFKRLKNVIDVVFNNKKDTFLENIIFADDQKLYTKLTKLHAQKTELQRLKALCQLSKPFVVEFCGTPRTGKTTILNNLYNFFKKGGFEVKLIEELTTSNYYKQTLVPQMNKLSTDEKNLIIISEAEKQLVAALEEQADIILIDRSLNDRLIWNHRCYLNGYMSEEQYNKSIKYYSQASKKLIDMLVIGYTDPMTSLKRDYYNSLSLEERKFLNEDNIKEFNTSMDASMSIFKNSVDDLLRIDTTNITPNESSIIIADTIMPSMRKKYILNFNEKYNQDNKN